MSNVVSIGSGVPTIFTIDEADELIPVVARITENMENEINKLMEKQRFYTKSGAPDALIKEIDVKVGDLLIKGGAKLTRLGLRVYPHGFVGFPAGFGYWSWIRGDKKIEWYHDLNESPFQRRQLSRIGGNVTPAR